MTYKELKLLIESTELVRDEKCLQKQLWQKYFECRNQSSLSNSRKPVHFCCLDEPDNPESAEDIWVSNFWSSSEFPPVDKNFSVANHEKLPSFCNEPWCFVDPNNCKHDFLGADRFGTVCDVSGGFAKVTSRIHYSYETCGGKYFPYSSFLRESRHFNNIRGKVLRTAMIDYKPFIYDASSEEKDTPQIFGKSDTR